MRWIGWGRWWHTTIRPYRCDPDSARGARAAGAPSKLHIMTPEGSAAYGLANQSTAFHVGPACVGFAKKFPSLGPTSSTFFR